MDNMDEVELFTVSVFQAQNRRQILGDSPRLGSQDPCDHENVHDKRPIAEFQNMVSARIIKGRMLELEHSNLAGPLIKFKTVINYEKSLDPNRLIGISFKSQEGYIKKDDDDD